MYVSLWMLDAKGMIAHPSRSMQEVPCLAIALCVLYPEQRTCRFEQLIRRYALAGWTTFSKG